MTTARSRVGLDARMIDNRQSGLGRYAGELARRLPALDPDLDYVIILRPGVDPGHLGRQPNAEIVRLPGWLDHPANLLAAPAINRLDLDLYHALHHFLPPGLSVRRVVLTLHDLIWVEHPQLTFEAPFAWLRGQLNGIYGRATMRHALSRADHVVAISHHTRHRAEARYRWVRGRITTVQHGATEHGVTKHDTADHGADADAAATQPTSPPFFLSLGNTKPYKNVPSVLRAFAKVAADHPTVALQVTGRGDSRRRLELLAAELGLTGRVRFTGMVDEQRLATLLGAAQALVFPSRVEGFGLPLVEAMAAGCPVITSSIPVVREAVGDAALAVDPDDIGALAAAMARLLDDEALRERLRELGRARARLFSWDRCAHETARVYRRLGLEGAHD